MSKLTMFLATLAVLAFAIGLSGCPNGSEAPGPQGAFESSDADHDHGEDADDEHGEEDHADHEDGTTEFAEALAQLSPEDRAAAEKQKICPVSDGPLGSMGKPFKVTVKDRDVFLCCEGCKDALMKDPDKYLAKLK